MKITIDNIEHDIKDGETLDISGFEFVGNGFDKSKADKLGVGTWNEKNIKNFVLLYTLIKSMYSKADIDSLFESLYTKNEVDVAIDDRINSLIGSAPQNLDTLYEISQRLGEDDTKITQILDLIASKADKTSLQSLSNILALKADKTDVSSLSSVPLGTALIYFGSVAPIGYMLCDGSALSRTTYAALYSVIGTSFGLGDGSTTFNIPDTRGYFLRGLDNGKGIDSGRTLGSVQQDEVKSHSHVLSARAGVGSSGSVGYNAGTGSVYSPTTASFGGAETRPKNLSVNYIIRVS